MFLLAYTEVTYSEVHYITPSLDGPCPQNFSCLTLPQFAANSIHNITNISLLFQPGNHALDRELFLTRVNYVSMSKDGLGNEKVFVDCSSSLGRFHISETLFVSINSLHFISCGSNIVSQVKWLTITGSTFQGVQNRTTVLEHNEISNATIVRSSFLSNSLNYHNISKNKLLDYVYFEQSTPRGVLYTAFSNVSVINCKFMHNRASTIGGALVVYNSSLYLARSTCSNNTANLAKIGGVVVLTGSKVNIDSNSFINNAAQYGGVIVAYNDTLTISSTTFANNSAGISGGVIITFGDSSFDVVNSTFTNNSAGIFGSVIFCMDTVSDSFKISDSFFTNNSAYAYGVITAFGDSSFDINNSVFANNSAQYGGVIASVAGNSSFNIRNSTFTNNSATNRGGVMCTLISHNSSFNISNSVFTNNVAAEGGVVWIHYGSLTVSNSIFVNNKATDLGAVIQCTDGTLKIDSSNFSLNVVFNRGGGVFIIRQCSTYITNSQFYQNNGSIFAFNSNITFSGYLKFEKFTEPIIANGVTSQEGGAITSFQSTVIFTRKSTVHFSNNRASHGGAILATESTITMCGETMIADSTANSSGGGISLKQSRLQIKGNCHLINNIAVRGGGIQASSSTIAVYKPGNLQITNNSAEFGGGIYLEVNPKLYVLKNTCDLISDGFMYLIILLETMPTAEEPCMLWMTPTLVLALPTLNVSYKHLHYISSTT